MYDLFCDPPLIGNTSCFRGRRTGFWLNSAAYISESIRGGILSVDKGKGSCHGFGRSKNSDMKDVIFPQAIKNIFPS
jgi:ABC-type amino acid transport system permease subunit